MKTFLIVCVGALLGTLLVMAAPPAADCATCPSFTCYNSAGCGGGCVCLKQGMDLSGSCYSTNRGE
jgi:hypothetical protein